MTEQSSGGPDDPAGEGHVALPLGNGTIGEAAPQLSGCMRCASDPDLCDRCLHAMDPHVVVATGSSAEEGGIILCPEPECTCWLSWSPNGMDSDRIRIPDLEETERIRAMIQRP